MRKELFRTLLFSMMLSSVVHTVGAQRTEDVTQWVSAAAIAKIVGVGAVPSGGIPVIDSVRMANSLMTNLNEFEKIMAYDKNIQEIFINIESTAEEGKNATRQALREMQVSQVYKDLVAGDTGGCTGTTGGSEQNNDNKGTESGQNLDERAQDAKAPQERLDKKQSSRDGGVNYVRENFFYKKPDQTNSQAVEDVEIEKIRNKRRKLIRDVVLDVLTYSQIYKEKGKADFQDRLQTVKTAQSKVKTETEAIATNTMALKNILQETMLQITLEQKHLKMEAVHNLLTQDIQLEE